VGAARAVHLSDPAFLGGDALATGRALAAALARDSFDLVLTGSQSDDVGYGGTGSVVAGHLGWPHVWLVMGVELEEGHRTARVTREMESGVNEVSRVRLPAVLEIQAGLNHPRYASLKGIMAAKKKEIAVVGPGDLGLDAGQVGEAGSRLEIISVSFPESGRGAQILEGDAKTAAAALVDKLQKEARVL
jgi:electron transfer flavoprotein beta subunit